MIAAPTATAPTSTATPIAIAAMPRAGLISRLLAHWFRRTMTTAKTSSETTEVGEDLRAALEAASMCQISALSAEYAHYLMDRHSGRG